VRVLTLAVSEYCSSSRVLFLHKYHAGTNPRTARRQMIGGNGTPVKIELQWTGSPEWLQPQVTVNQQVNHITQDIIKSLVESSDDDDSIQG
jgi:hypothetical protein